MTAVVLFVSVSGTSRAEVTLTGAGEPLPGPAITVEGDFGDTAGNNLFHSFGVFNILSSHGESVTFTPPSADGSINFVISRVTGGTSEITGAQYSFIDGPLNSTIPGASFFFINPHGVIFGDKASLDIDGSFHASTADFVRLGEEGIFYADPTKTSVLKTAPPSAFGFMSSNPGGSISVGTQSFSILQVPAGETLSLVGGTINLGAADGSAPAFVFAPAGNINLISMAAPVNETMQFEATINEGGAGFNVDPFAQLGDVNLSGGSIVDGENVFIRAGRFTIDNAIVVPGFFSTFALGPPPDGGEVDVEVSGDMTITGTAPVFGFTPGIYTFSGSGGSIGAPADVPDIAIDAGALSLLGIANIRSERFGPGTPAEVMITADTLVVRDGAFIAVNNYFDGPGGTLSVNAGQIELSGDGNPGFTGLAAQSLFHPSYSSTFDPALSSADGGNISINVTGTGSLIVRAGAEISADSFSLGRGGNIDIHTTNLLLSRDGANTGVIATQSVIAGGSGNINIEATGTTTIQDGFQITASTGGAGDGGNVSVSGSGPINISGSNSGIFSATTPTPQATLDQFAARFVPGLDFETLLTFTGVENPQLSDVLTFLVSLGLIDVANPLPGDAGQVFVETPSLTMTNGARIDSSTLTDGNAGAIVGRFGSASVSSGSRIASRSGGFDLTTGELLIGQGNAGSIDIITTGSNTLTVSGAGSAISTSTLGDGNAGNIQLRGTGVQILNGGSVTSESGDFSPTGELVVGTGNAGTIDINATGGSTLTVSGSGSAVSTSTLGEGDAGNITLRGAQIHIRNDGRVTSESSGDGLAGDIAAIASNEVIIDNGGSISTEALTSDGGNIFVKAGNLIALFNSEVTTSVQSGFGEGGNIELDPPAIVLQNSQVIANAFGGDGGNINIVASQFIVDPFSVVDASSALGIDGVVDIDAPDTTVTGDLVPLTKSLLDASRLLRDRCGVARAAGGSSSLVASGRGGVSVEPDGYLPSFGAGALDAGVAAVDPDLPVAATTLAAAGGYLPNLWRQECP